MTTIAAGAARLNPFHLAATVVDDLTVAIARADDSAARIQQLIAQFGEGTLDDVAKAATKDARIGAHRVNMEGQERLAKYVDGVVELDPSVRSRVLNADARLEDANWQLASKPSPDGRFNGTDLPGALRDTIDARTILDELVPVAT